MATSLTGKSAVLSVFTLISQGFCNEMLWQWMKCAHFDQKISTLLNTLFWIFLVG